MLYYILGSAKMSVSHDMIKSIFLMIDLTFCFCQF